jgi:hypothetical protein
VHVTKILRFQGLINVRQSLRSVPQGLGSVSKGLRSVPQALKSVPRFLRSVSYGFRSVSRLSTEYPLVSEVYPNRAKRVGPKCVPHNELCKGCILIFFPRVLKFGISLWKCMWRCLKVTLHLMWSQTILQCWSGVKLQFLSQ